MVFSNKKVYVGSTCEELKTRLEGHLTNKNSAVFKYKDKKTKIELIINAPSYDKKSLGKVENGHIEEYADKYGERLLNKRNNPLKTKKIEYKVEIENESKLEKRIKALDKKLTIKDDTKNKRFFFDAVVNGERHNTVARYTKCSKEEGLSKIEQKKQDKINELFTLIKHRIFY